VQPGTLTALIGPNGAGKTTLFALMLGFLRPMPARVRFDGRDITGSGAPHLNARAGMTRTFQIVQPFAGADRAREHRRGRAPAPRRRPTRRPHCAQAVAARVGLADQLDKPAGRPARSPGASASSSARALATRAEAAAARRGAWRA
jgi:branched-chain amino acid transport system ATP-binding protein